MYTIKSEFGDSVAVDLMLRNIQTGTYDMEIGVERVLVLNYKFPLSRQSLGGGGV